ncbi:MAG: four helix bundle protein [Planctomycetes bacterium]|nr:four helix bundle protein [Planctomycetota bacterium]
MAGSFYDLKIWQNGYDLLMNVYDITSRFPKEELYSLTTQLRNSANSVIANIAESHGRYYFADKIRVLYTARGEAEETRSHLRVALGRKYIPEETFSRMDKSYEGLGKGISSYIKSLRKE